MMNIDSCNNIDESLTLDSKVWLLIHKWRQEIMFTLCMNIGVNNSVPTWHMWDGTISVKKESTARMFSSCLIEFFQDWVDKKLLYGREVDYN